MDLFTDMQLQSRVSTELPTPAAKEIAADALVSGRIMWRTEIGRGSFALVEYAWDVQTRVEYALKKPRPEACYDLRCPEGVTQALVGFRGEESKSEPQQMRVVTSNSGCIVKIDHRERLDTC